MHQSSSDTTHLQEKLIESLSTLSVQAFFTLGPQLTIEQPYSQECKIIFGQNPEGKTATNLLFDSPGQQSDFAMGLGLIFEGKTKPQVIFDLLPQEIEHNDRRLRCAYRMLSSDKLVMILTDVTRERRFQALSKRDVERRFVVLKVAAHRSYFAQFMQEAQNLFSWLTRFEQSEGTREDVAKLKIFLHTFKGNASFFDLIHTVDVAHQYEDHLEDVLILGEQTRHKQLGLALKRAYFEELGYVSTILGERWIKEAGAISIPSQDYKKLENYLRVNFPGDKKLGPFLQRYRATPLRNLFVQIPAYASQLGQRLGKKIHPMIIEGGETFVLPEVLYGLAESMVHLIRNSLDHGIENTLVREAKGKDPSGSLRLVLGKSQKGLQLVFSDDGSGIDSKQVLKWAYEKGLLSDKQNPTEQELMQLLFLPGFSTKNHVDDLSGRGIGLAAVKREVETLGGSIAIHSRLGRGTSFEIFVPHTRRPEA